ncbi:MAG: hypothetical protein PHC88_08695 [Terrimicrobiaceae bacterium]|nr:hypothetical protein [Terrimicrobiaceae bacterium]
MTTLRQYRWTSALVALLAIFAWIIASNHCALAAVGHPAKHSCCHEPCGGKPVTQCCEAFNVPMPDQASAPAVHLHALGAAWTDATNASAFGDDPAALVSSACATGPPPGAGFAETVLNRSLLAHAPPVCVA